MRKNILIGVLLLFVSAVSFAQKNGIEKKYGMGAVPVKDGKVEFEQDFVLNGKSKAEIYNSLLSFAQGLTKAENSLPQCRVSTSDEANGLVAVNMEEWMYFKRTAWVTNRTRFYYQLVFKIKDGGYTALLRGIRYLADEERGGGQTYSAEGWITDDKAIVKNGTKLSKYSGKFRTFTIDRKDELFQKAYSAAGGKTKKRVRKVVYQEVEE